MISDYFFYLACVIGFLLIVRVIYVFEKSYEQFKKELPEIVKKEQHEKAVKRAVRERYKRIESEAFRKYPGLGGNYLKKRDYIKRKWRRTGG